MLSFSFALMGPLLIDSDIGRSKEFLHHSSEYCLTIPAWAALKFVLPSFLYKASSWFLPSAWKIRKHLREVQKLVLPEIQGRKDKTTTTLDILQALLEVSYGAKSEISEEEMVNHMLFVLFAGAELLAVVLCQLIYTIMAYPEYEKELLEEAFQAVDKCGGWNKTTVACMPKFDRFLKEVLRMNPPICCKPG